jgi:hypothetical protein
MNKPNPVKITTPPDAQKMSRTNFNGVVLNEKTEERTKKYKEPTVCGSHKIKLKTTQTQPKYKEKPTNNNNKMTTRAATNMTRRLLGTRTMTLRRMVALERNPPSTQVHGIQKSFAYSTNLGDQIQRKVRWCV